MRECDVLIIGAGPAGSFAAKALKDHNVILVDKAQFPRDKLCAGVLPPKVRTIVDMPENIVERPLRGYRIHPPSGKTLESSFPTPGAIVDRSIFDNHLLGDKTSETSAITNIEGKAGALIAKGDGQEYKAKLVIGADGCSSVARKAIGVKQGLLASSAQYTIELLQETIDYRIGDWFEVYYTMEHGYGWISPLNGKIKVGVGIVSDHLDKPIWDILDEFTRHETVREKIEGGEILDREGHSIPMSGPLDPLADNGILLAGDAGGFVYPGTGEGIYYAMQSGRTAGEVASSVLASENYGDLLQLYNTALEKNGLLALRDVDFVERCLSTSEKAEAYVRKLRLVASR